MAERDEEQELLAARVATLEKTVEALEERLAVLDSGTEDRRALEGTRRAGAEPLANMDAPRAVRADAASQTQRPGAASISPSTPSRRAPRTASDPGQWVNRLGIALVLVGAAFGFKYSIDRGWIGPSVRVLSGLALGASMLLASTRVRPSRPGLSRVLAGGGIASTYLSIYAAFHLYGLLSQGPAIAAMSAVTVAAFVVSVRSDDAMTATIGTIGGLATPVLLSTSAGNVPGLVVYTAAVVAGAGAVFLRSGWRVVLWTSAAGGWLLMAGAADLAEQAGRTEAIVTECGIVFVALATWWLAVAREVAAAEHPERWREASFGVGPAMPPAALRGDWTLQPHQLALSTPLVVLGLSTWTWQLERHASGWLAIALGAAWIVAAARLERLAIETAKRLAATHAMGAAVLVAFALALLLDGDAARVALAVEALAVIALAARSDGRQPALIGHLLFLYVAMQTWQRLLGSADVAAIGSAAWSDLVVLGALGAAGLLLETVEERTYLVAAQAGLLMWLRNALSPLDDSAAWITASWFANALVLIVAGLRLDSAALRGAGAAVMALTMGKLFLFDMQSVGAGLRIVTFLGFGAVLLGLGYAFPALWKRTDPEE